MFSELSLNQDYYADKVSIFLALGPVMKLTNSGSSLIQFFAANENLLIATANTLGIHEIFPANYLATGAMRLFCGIVPAICKFGVYLIADEDTTLDDSDRLLVYLAHFPAGTSIRCLVHYGQILNANKFQQYDWGSAANKKIYGQPTAPEFNLSGITAVPIGMFVGQDDELADASDNEWAH